MTHEIVPATEEHCRALAKVMRADDVREIWASHRSKPYEALRHSAMVSRDTKTGVVDGRPVCMFGVAPRGSTLAPFGSPWLLGAEELPQHGRAFLRLNRAWVAEQMEIYSLLENWIDARNVVSIRWLKWLGFAIFEPTPFGPDQLPFHRFEMRR